MPQRYDFPRKTDYGRSISSFRQRFSLQSFNAKSAHFLCFEAIKNADPQKSPDLLRSCGPAACKFYARMLFYHLLPPKGGAQSVRKAPTSGSDDGALRRLRCASRNDDFQLLLFIFGRPQVRIIPRCENVGRRSRRTPSARNDRANDGRRRGQRPLADFAEPPQSKRRVFLRRKQRSLS